MVRKTEEERFAMKMEILTMGNGMMAKYLALEDTCKRKMIRFLKAFGKKANIAAKNIQNKSLLFNSNDRFI